MKSLMPIALVAALLGGCASMHAQHHSPAKVADGMLVGPNQMTLYTFDRDTAGSGKSVCNGPCATNWPPFMAAADAKPEGEWTIVERTDGARMWAYDGKPLYTFVKDTKPGEVMGDGANDVWHVAKPD